MSTSDTRLVTPSDTSRKVKHMERSKTIIYLCTEDNAKSCLGLEEVLEDGWNVELVVAYITSSSSSAKKSALRRIRQWSIALLKRFKCVYSFLHKSICGQTPDFQSMKAICERYQIPYCPTSDKTLASLKDNIENLSPDVILSNGWQFRISSDIFSLARLAALNCHSSYLPEYRGGNVTYAPLINEEKHSGVTVHQLVDKFDAGSILAQERVSIEPGETPYSLNMKRARVTGQVLIKALEVAGKSELYKPNPPSPFYFRCDYRTYKRYKRINFLRKLIGLPIKRYAPKERYDI